MKALFVCTGNTCRSVMAQFLFNRAVEERGLNGWEARSCGIAADPGFEIPSPVPRVLAQRGIENFSYIPRTPSLQLLEWADGIYAMARNHREALKEYFPQTRDKTELFLEAAGLGARDIADPIGQGERVYAQCRDLIEEGVRRLIDKHAPSTAKPRS